MNQFSDLLTQEAIEMYFSKDVQSLGDFACNGPQAPTVKIETNFTTDPSKISKTIATQGQCASGYAFATIGAV